MKDGHFENICPYYHSLSMKTRYEDLNELIPVHTTVTQEELDGEKVFRVTKRDKIMQFDENTLVKLRDVDFHNGIIRVKMLSRLLPEAPYPSV